VQEPDVALPAGASDGQDLLGVPVRVGVGLDRHASPPEHPRLGAGQQPDPGLVGGQRPHLYVHGHVVSHQSPPRRYAAIRRPLTAVYLAALFVALGATYPGPTTPPPAGTRHAVAVFVAAGLAITAIVIRRGGTQ
jgi:hypothetical protein